MKRGTGMPPKKVVRPGGSNRPGPPTDFIALGKSKTELPRYGQEPSVPSMKKTPTFHSAPSSSPHHSRMSPTIPEPSVRYIDSSPNELVKKVTDAHGDQETVDGLVCGAIRTIRNNRLKPDHVVMYSLMVLAKKQPSIFRSEMVTECLVGLLKKDIGLDYIKSKGNCIAAVLACNLLHNGFEQNFNWPSLLVKVFIEDSLGDRIWVDHQQCRKFVSSVCTAFDTIPIPADQNSDSGDDSDSKARDNNPPLKRFTVSAELVRLYSIDMVRERASRRQGTISAQDPMGAASGQHLLRTLTVMCGISEVRVLAAHKLEMWLQNPKLTKATQDLLMSICINCREHNQDDVDVIGHLTKIRLKSKALLTHYIHCLKALIDAHKDSINTLFNYVVYNELSSARNPTNMSVIASLMQHKPKVAAETLAIVCQDLLLQPEDYLRAVRALLREIVRQAKHELHFSSFALGIMKAPDQEKFARLDQAHKERFVASTADLICLTMLVSISPAVKEAVNVVAKKHPAITDIDHETVYRTHKLEIAAMQRDAVWWLHSTVIPTVLPKMTTQDLLQYLHKVLFLKSQETYYMKDNWPPESERMMMVRHCAEVPVLEDTILRLAVIGLSHSHPLAPNETLDLISQLVRRAGNLNRADFNPVPIERSDVIDTLLSLSQYHHPENIHLPKNYVPPSLAISVLYWSVWQTLLVISSFNPSTLGLQAWNEYPLLRSFMEMAIINNFTFPIATIVDENERSQVISKEMLMLEMEKNEILEFESHLAAATTHLSVTEETSLLLAQLIAMDSKGPLRRPPDGILNQTRVLCSQVQVGANLCRSRDPDFLLSIIERHGEDRAMPWLSGLVGSARGDMSMLPVQCLCEYLMAASGDDDKAVTQENDIVDQLRRNLQEKEGEESWQAINYFLRRLHSPQFETRTRAKHAISRVLDPSDTTAMETDQPPSSKAGPLTEYDWLLKSLPALQNYHLVRSKAVDAISEAIMWDNEEASLAAYVTFLAEDLSKQDSSSDDTAQCASKYALSIAHLLIDRQPFVKNMMQLGLGDSFGIGKPGVILSIFVESLLKIMLCHLRMAKTLGTADPEQTLEEIPWRDTQDEIFLRWPQGGGHAQLHILVSQAMILLLTYGLPSHFSGKIESANTNGDALYLELLFAWFLEDGMTSPKAYLMDTQEEALLLPDWLRLKMLHCEVNEFNATIPIAACKDLDLEQLLLFIQSFGIPYSTMDHLLRCLDDFCASSPDSVKAMVKDNTSYLLKLVEGQWKRGCCNGTDFHALLSVEKLSARPSVIHTASGNVTEIVDLTIEQSEESDVMIISSPERMLTSSQDEEDDEVAMIMDDNIANMLQDLFMSSTPGSDKLKKRNSKIFRNLIRTLTVRGSQEVVPITTCISEIHALVSAKKTGPAFLNGLYANPMWSCTLLRKLDSSLKKVKQKKYVNGESLAYGAKLFQKLTLMISKKAPSSLPSTNRLVKLLHSWDSQVQKSEEGTTEGLGQLDWARLEEFLRKQLAFLGRDEEIKNKVALVAQILLEEIGNRKAKTSRGKSDAQDDSFYASIGTTGLLIDWLQLLDPELLAHRPKLQRKLLFESRRTFPTSMPIKMSAKISSLKLPQSFTSHQTYLLSLLTEHSNWETVYKSLQWLLSDATCDPTTEKQGKSQSSQFTVDARTAMDFFWVCLHTSKIWKGRENKSSSLQEPVFYLSSKEFCHVLTYMVASTSKQATQTSSKTSWGETSYFELFFIFYLRFGQKELKSENLESTVKFIYTKAEERGSDLWWQLLAQLYILEPFHDVWNEPTHSGSVIMEGNIALEKIITSTEVGSICHTDGLIQMLLDRIGYVKESGHVDARESVTAIQSNIDSAYDASLLLKKFASSRPSIVLRQLSLMLVSLSGRTWYEFREFKAKNHLLFMQQLLGILEAVGHGQLFDEEYAEDVDKIFETYLQMTSNYCVKARRQMRDIMHDTLKLVHVFLQRKPFRAYRITYPHGYTLQTLLERTYSDYEYIVTLIRKIMKLMESASLAPAPSKTEIDSCGDFLTIDHDTSDANETAAPYLKMLAKNPDLENYAQILSDLTDTKKRVINLEPFLPYFTQMFTTCRDSSIRHSALSATVTCMRASPSRAFHQVLPAYLACLTSSKISAPGGTNSPNQAASEIAISQDEIARTALDFLPEMVVLCREKAPEILNAAFECGSRDGVGVQPPGAQGVLGTPLAVGGNSTWQDLSELLAKSLTLLSGLTQSNIKPAPV